MLRLDTYDRLPDDMRQYLSINGWHFSKALCEWAVERMRDRNGNRIQLLSKEEVENTLRTAGVNVKRGALYDCVYVFQMAMADYFGSSLKDTASVALYVSDHLDDIDGTDTRAMDEFMGRSIGAGVPIPWDEVL